MPPVAKKKKGKHLRDTDALIRLGNRIKKLREKWDMSQRELAEDSKVARYQLSRIERGISDPTYSVLRRIAEALDVNLSDLID